jgi:hypothetical protein
MLEIRRLDRDNLRPDNGLMAQRLMPWDALNAPFEGSWCVVKPGAESGARQRTPFVAGDVVHFRPHIRHQVVNRSDRDFEMYAIWWDADLSDRFGERHRGGG